MAAASTTQYNAAQAAGSHYANQAYAGGRSDAGSNSSSGSSTGFSATIIPFSAPDVQQVMNDPDAAPEERIILYSHALYEYTRQLWLDARRQAEQEASKRKEANLPPGSHRMSPQTSSSTASTR